MFKTAFVFPGQGSQSVGMGLDLYEKYKIAKDLYDRADEIMGFELSKYSFNGPAELLKETQITQPALFINSYILTQLLTEKLKADCTAGHSLGEFTANAYAKSISFEDGLKLVKKRGELMKQSGEIQQGTMAAFIGLTEDTVIEICNKAENSGVVQPANFNCPGQIVISGDISAVEKAILIAKSEPYKCKIAKRLEVSGAFHSDLMKTSYNEFCKEVEMTQISDSQIPVYVNVDGTPVNGKEKIKNYLCRQLISPVRWELSVKNMIADGVNKFYEIGSGKVLSGLIKKIDSSVNTFNISNAEDIERFNEI